MKTNFLSPSIIASLLFLGVGANAQAAPIRITQIEGKVFVSTAQGYVQAQPGMILNSGDRVMTLAGSSARVTYPDNCAVQVGANNLFIMGEKNQCIKGEKTRLPRRLPKTPGAGSGTAATGTTATGTTATGTTAAGTTAAGTTAAGTTAAGTTAAGTTATGATATGATAAGTAAVGTAAVGTAAVGTAAAIGGIPTAVIGIGAVVGGTGAAIATDSGSGNNGSGNQPISPE